tara:strand:+ start:317 stop:769 length:453 start_codon:yes stop_codon:yes gene_type:complete
MPPTNSENADALKSSLDSGKKFSDYVGFHVRIFFCMQIAWFLVAPDIIEYINSRNRGVPFIHGQSYMSYFVASLLLLYGAILTFYISRTLHLYLVQRIFIGTDRFFGVNYLIGIASMCTGILIYFSVCYASFMQMLNLMRIPFEQIFKSA